MAEDYRDTLIREIEKQYGSRYKFSKSTGISESFLCKVKGKHKHLSIPRLMDCLSLLGLEIKLVPIAGDGAEESEDEAFINDVIDRWHQSTTIEPLYSYLGLGLVEYSAWVSDPDTLPQIIGKVREKHTEVDSCAFDPVDDIHINGTILMKFFESSKSLTEFHENFHRWKRSKKKGAGDD